MKTQIPRISDQPRKRYSGVYEQMGRMLDAADWNEQVDVVKRGSTESLDCVVGNGVPANCGVALVQQRPRDPLKIKAGFAFARGVLGHVVAGEDVAGASEFDFKQQADFKGAPILPRNIADLRFYVDLWDRTVLSLEDRELKDAGLGGADTCTRSQRMAQVKWCPERLNPEEEGDNPRVGTAKLNLTLRKKQTKSDPCDPCAEKVNLKARVGNYLFRVEVHEVEGSAHSPTGLTLKWSTENAAEQYRVGEEPEDFKSDGEWVYEYYGEEASKHLGVHLATGFSPVCGVLKEGYPDLEPDLPYVRRWDGYVTLEHDRARNWSLATNANGDALGVDRGVELSETIELGEASPPGEIALGPKLGLSLDTLTLELDLDDVAFVQGDYWLGMVREAIHDIGAVVLKDGSPLGIVHNYLLIGETDGTGALVDFETAGGKEFTDRWRRLNFPPLADLEAQNVGYETACQGPAPFFTADHDTVKKALDRLCDLNASDVEFSPHCERLKGADTVQGALDILCTHEHEGTSDRGGCKVTVGPEAEGGMFPTLEVALQELSKRNEACLCLLPGWHEIGPLRLASRPPRICICGCGPGSGATLSGDLVFEKLQAIDLRCLDLKLEGAATVRFSGCDSVGISGCRMSASGFGSSMVEISSAATVHLDQNKLSPSAEGRPALSIGSGAQRVTLTDNVIEGTFTLYEGKPKRGQPTHELLGQVVYRLRKGTSRFEPSGCAIAMSRNTLSRLAIGSQMVEMLNGWVEGKTQITDAYERAHLTDNTISLGGSRFLALDLSLSSNAFLAEDEDTDVATFVAHRGMYLGNFAEARDDRYQIHSFARDHKPMDLTDHNFAYFDTHKP